MIEIKPYKETIEPIVNKRKAKKTILYEKKTWETNKRKWSAAKAYCDRKGWKFKIVTEKDIFK